VTWLRATAPGERPLDRVFGLRPPAYSTFRELYDALWDGGVDAATMDACRDRIDALVRCEPDPTRDRALDDASRAAVAYAEQYALDPHGLRDSDFDVLHGYYTDAQLATLTLAIAMFDALARFSVALEV
jgi:alkylhydroperoxidase family enzyme